MSSVLLIAGLDPSGGTGLLADAAVVERHQLRPVGVATALGEQSSAGILAIHPVAAGAIGAQLTALLSDLEVAAVKVGSLGSGEVAREVAHALALTAAPLVWHPHLLSAGSRTALHDGEPGELLDLMRDHATVIAPSRLEAGILCGFPIEDVAAMRRAATVLARGRAAALVWSGKAPSLPAAVLALGDHVTEIGGEDLEVGTVRGIGCALTTALACNLAAGLPLADAACGALAFVQVRLASPVRSGRGLASLL